MTLLRDDQIAETTVTTGTGTISLDGAQTGYSKFRDIHADGARVGYAIFVPGGDFERGLGRLTYGTPDTVSRDVVLVSSNGGTGLVDFPAGTKQATGSFQTATASAVAAPGLVRVHRNGTNQNITASVVSRVVYSTKDLDPQNWFDLTLDRYVPKLPGWYEIHVHASFLAPGADLALNNRVVRNGTLEAISAVIPSTSANASCIPVTVKLFMDGDADYVEHNVDAAGSGTKTILGASRNTYFEARRVG